MLTHRLIHHFLEESARVFPNKVALIHEDVRATYAEINDKANQMARWLMGEGIIQGDTGCPPLRELPGIRDQLLRRAQGRAPLPSLSTAISSRTV